MNLFSIKTPLFAKRKYFELEGDHSKVMTAKCYKAGFKDGELSHVLTVHLRFNPIPKGAETAIEL